MPSIASHFVSAQIISSKLNVNKDDFYRGIILPDIIDNLNSHYKLKGKYYMIPDISYYESIMDNSSLAKGYLAHLLLDKIFLEEYVPQKVKNFNKINLFSANMMYNDYTSMNYLLIKKYNLNLNYINFILNIHDAKLNKEKYLLNKKSINSLKIGNLNYLDFDDFTKFLEETSMYILDYLKR